MQSDVTQELFSQALKDADVDKIIFCLTSDLFDINFRDVSHDLQTPLMRLCHVDLQDPTSLRHILQAVSGRQPNANQQDNLGRTLAMHACIANNSPMMEYALTHGCDVTVTDRKGRNLVHYAATSGGDDVIDRVLRHPNVQAAFRTLDFQGYSPVDLARQKKNSAVARKFSAAMTSAKRADDNTLATTSDRQHDRTAVTSDRQHDRTGVTSDRQHDRTAVTSDRQHDRTGVTSDRQHESTAVKSDDRTFSEQNPILTTLRPSTPTFSRSRTPQYYQDPQNSQTPRSSNTRQSSQPPNNSQTPQSSQTPPTPRRATEKPQLRRASSLSRRYNWRSNITIDQNAPLETDTSTSNGFPSRSATQSFNQVRLSVPQSEFNDNSTPSSPNENRTSPDKFRTPGLLLPPCIKPNTHSPRIVRKSGNSQTVLSDNNANNYFTEPSNKKFSSSRSPVMPVKKQLLQHSSSFRNIQNEDTRDEQFLTVPSNLRRENVERRSFRSSRTDNPETGPMCKRQIKQGDNQTRGVNLKIDNSTAIFEEDFILGKQSDNFGSKNLEEAVWSERHQGRRSSISLPDLREMSGYLVSSNTQGTPPPGRRLGGEKNKDREDCRVNTEGEGSDSDRSLDSNFEDETPVNFRYYPKGERSYRSQQL